ncbi:hypothetical protein TNCV_95471 [Trichonephila clavipes]|nr:hypothetical protein TNCV_95471 [Trichonephila clavipes]
MVDTEQKYEEKAVPLRYGGTLNNRRAASFLVKLMEKKEGWEVPDHPQDILPQNWSGTEPNCTVTCVAFKATANDSRTTSPLATMNFVGLDLILLPIK